LQNIVVSGKRTHAGLYKYVGNVLNIKLCYTICCAKCMIC